MSSGPWRPGAPGGPSAGSPNASPQRGSVKAARQKLDAGQREQRAMPPPPPMPQPLAPSYRPGPHSPVSPRSGRPQQTARPPPGPTLAAAQPSPGMQWPLRNDGADDLQAKRSPPRRPPRPSYVPSILDPSHSGGSPQEAAPPPSADGGLSPRHTSSPQDSWDDGYLSPTYSSSNNSRPLTTSSQGSGSSLGSIPDFPVPLPVIQQAPRRSPSIGPPPSARRGPSSYYSQTLSYVSPIAEETEQNRSHGSYASSNVIPKGQPAFYLEDGETPTDDDGPVSGRSSRAEDHTDQTNLVRQASLGKRHKPSLTTIKADDKTMRKRSRLAPTEDEAGLSPPDSFRGGTGFLDASGSDQSSSESIPTIKSLEAGRTPRNHSRDRSPERFRDSEVNHVLEGLEKGGAIGPDVAASMMPSRSNSLADRVGERRPPRLNVDTTREAEARGSLTSLPDLIRRATKLAANLDRGRTASRLGMEWFVGDSMDKGRRSPRRDDDRRRSGSISDILANFPPPGAATPTGEKQSRRQSVWPAPGGGYSPSPLRTFESGTFAPDKPPQPSRRWCGMRPWVFLMLLVILLILIAAAVVIPVALIVLPDANDASSRPTSTGSGTGNPPIGGTVLTDCQQTLPCQHGGTSVLDAAGRCACVCSNGFTGAQCTRASDAACTTMRVPEAPQDATVGFAVVPLLTQAEEAFGVPLNASQVLGRFSAADVSCEFENALVTFDGQTSRAKVLGAEGGGPAAVRRRQQKPRQQQQRPKQQNLPKQEPQKEQPLGDEQKHAAPAGLPPPASTTNGLLVAATSTPRPQHDAQQTAPTRPPTQQPTRSPSSNPSSQTTPPTTTSPSSDGNESNGVTPRDRALDFARVAVLFVVQEASAGLPAGVDAQRLLQAHFDAVDRGNADEAGSVDVGGGGSGPGRPGFVVDFGTLAIRLPGGGSVGGWGR